MKIVEHYLDADGHTITLRFDAWRPDGDYVCVARIHASDPFDIYDLTSAPFYGTRREALRVYLALRRADLYAGST